MQASNNPASRKPTGAPSNLATGATLHEPNAKPGRIAVRLAAVFLLALAVRVAYQVETADIPLARSLQGDAAGYYLWATNIAAGDWIGTEPFYQAPAYPYFLACLMKAGCESVQAIRFVQGVLGAIGVTLIALVAGHWFNRRAGTITGVLFALYPPAIFFDGIIQKASLTALLIASLLALCVLYRRRRSVLAASAIGLALALLILTRENALIWLPVVLVWVAMEARKYQPGKAAVAIHVIAFFVGLGAALVPVGVRNAHVGGEWSFSTFQLGPNFYIGNSATATGRYQPLVPGHETPVFERTDAARLAEQSTGRSLSAREVSRFWLDRTIDDIRDQPARWLKLVGLKSLMAINRYEVADVESAYAYAQYSMVLASLRVVWHFGVLLPLAVLGMALMWPRRRELWLLYAMIVTMLVAVAAFYVMARYRYPLVVLLMPFAGAGIVEGLGLWQRKRGGGAGESERRYAAKGARREVGEGMASRPYASHAGTHRATVRERTLVVAVVLAGVAAVVANVRVHPERQLDAFALMNLGVAAAQEDDVEMATELFRRAVRINSTSANAHFNLAQALMQQGKLDSALRHFAQAAELAPDSPEVHFFLAVCLEQLGRTGEAIDAYRAALRLNPADHEARAAIERLGS